MKISFIVNGDPHGKGRPRFAKMGNFVKTYTDKDTELYENKVLMCYKDKLKEYGINETDILFPKGSLVKLSVECYFSLNKCYYGKKGLNKSGRTKLDNIYCDKKPDIDNVLKSIQDGLNGVAYSDDNQVVGIVAYKKYTDKQSRVEITLEDIDITTE